MDAYPARIQAAYTSCLREPLNKSSDLYFAQDIRRGEQLEDSADHSPEDTGLGNRLERDGKKTRRAEFLEKMEQVVLWGEVMRADRASLSQSG
jgi:hypothetical protein